MTPSFPNIPIQMPLQPTLAQQKPRFPKWVTDITVIVFLLSFGLCIAVYGYPMELRYATISILSVLVFFFGGQQLLRSIGGFRNQVFVRNIFWIGLIVHLLWVFYCFFYFNMDYYGNIHGDDADTGWYMDFAYSIRDWVLGGFQRSFEELRVVNGSNIDDCGYPLWLSVGYLIWGNWGDTGKVLIPMIIKCIITTYSAILIYRIGQRHFEEGVARLACIFVALNPNMIYWCGTMFKEPELVFLCCLYVNEMDKVLGRSQRATINAILPAMLVGLYIFLFRTALGLVAVAAPLVHVVFASRKIISAGKKALMGVFMALFLAIGFGDSLTTKLHDTVDSVQSSDQQENMEWRTKRKGGNSFAKYAGATVFAPLIFTIPFPTFNQALDSQILQAMLSGGSFIKNVFSFFVVLSLVILLFSGKWRNHVFLIAFMCGYLAALVLSNFAQSGRFHMPIMPFLMLFAAYGISLVDKHKKWRSWYGLFLAAEVCICLAWNWFKLAGRGMI